MDSHVKVLGVIHIVLGALSLVAGLAVLAIFGGIAGVMGTVGAAEDPDALMAVPILAIVGIAICVLAVVLALPCLIAGYGLLNFRSWARILTLVLSAINLLNVPIGTAIGVYGLWVLLQPETEPLFNNRLARNY